MANDRPTEVRMEAHTFFLLLMILLLAARFIAEVAASGSALAHLRGCEAVPGRRGSLYRARPPARMPWSWLEA